MLRYLLLASIFAMGCAAELDSGPEVTEDERADITTVEKKVKGSCEVDDCGDKGTGNCWCDDDCENYGDCCSNKADVCDAPPTEGQPCTGDGELPCGEGEYCYWADPDPALCGVLGVTGVCQVSPTECPDVFDPVCACNGFNYGSECEAAMEGSGIYYKGVCF